MSSTLPYVARLVCLWGACAFLDPTYAAGVGLCASGKQQSPIDIVGAVRQNLRPLQFAYRSETLKLANDGHTVRVRFGVGSELRIANTVYRLQQFHFHTPGGDRIGGEEFPMVAHLLHKSASGQLLALAVLFRLGAENPTLTRLLPRVPSSVDGDHVYPDVSVDATALLPTTHAYYRYLGSLTAPPCTEGVQWIVMKATTTLSAAQLAQYKTRFADNARSVQALNQRTVSESP
ncbi:MAG: carbonic anhydrase family protein [Betaproteobacteria bacterium]